MGAPKGNQYYLIRTTNGRNKKYSPNSLLKKANEYFIWVLENPLMEAKWSDKSQSIIEIPKMRTLSIQGFCNFADICKNTFYSYENQSIEDEMDEKELKKAKDFLNVTSKIRGIIENYQLEGAASGFLNQNIISSLLGLVSKQELSGDPEKPVMMSKVTMLIKERKNEEDEFIEK